jgi:DNA-binding CsgD family transcriptional regulator
MALHGPAGGRNAGATAAAAALGVGVEGMAPRMRETLDHLLRGDSEKQIANKLGISQHTVHVYVKRLYRHYGASSRGELLARFVARGTG